MALSKSRMVACGGAAIGMTFGLSLGLGATSAVALPSSLYVSPSAPGGGDTSCATAQYSTISAAVTAAVSGDTIEVCPGTYDESVSLGGKSLTINGSNGGTAVIDAINQINGVSIMGATTANSTIANLTVENAKREGITVGGTSGITLMDDIVTQNDQMCQPQLTLDDCGESIDLEAVTNSTVKGNTVSKGTGGILISDGIPAGSIGAHAFGATTPYSGPTSGNIIENNNVTDNVWDCGITMPSHNSDAVVSGVPAPAAGGVFNNTIENNVVQGNGTSGGGGSGILMAGPFPGTGVYNNTVTGNTVSGNGEGGIVIHSHAPGEDMNGNTITANTIGMNAVGETGTGVGVFTRATSIGDSGVGDPSTTGIEVFSAAVPVTGTTIHGNTISDNHYGIWVYNASTSGISSNTFTSVAVSTYYEPAYDSGYSIVTNTGMVGTYGKNTNWGNAVGDTGGSPVVGIADTPDAGGYWVATANGGVFSFGDAAFYGSTGGIKLVQPVVGITATPDGHGYWLVAADGGVFSYGDAKFYGSTGGVKLVQPVVGITTTPDGKGYWLTAKDGGVFSFGDATFHGSTGGVKLTKPVVGIATTSTGAGYWLVASDGGVFAFGDAKFHGSTGGVKLVQPVVGMQATFSNGGYWLVAADGGVFAFGDAHFAGSAGNNQLGSPVVGIAEGQPFLVG
ncbi:MAG: right-handed parallel beta-helix repeat-containing protein [Actinomycetota bacterium]|nr:right-handed parallel beta-helix repeat-containing protein [Actinomycetota bacterium]